MKNSKFQTGTKFLKNFQKFPFLEKGILTFDFFTVIMELLWNVGNGSFFELFDYVNLMN